MNGGDRRRLKTCTWHRGLVDDGVSLWLLTYGRLMLVAFPPQSASLSNRRSTQLRPLLNLPTPSYSREPGQSPAAHPPPCSF